MMAAPSAAPTMPPARSPAVYFSPLAVDEFVADEEEGDVAKTADADEELVDEEIVLLVVVPVGVGRTLFVASSEYLDERVTAIGCPPLSANEMLV